MHIYPKLLYHHCEHITEIFISSILFPPVKKNLWPNGFHQYSIFPNCILHFPIYIYLYIHTYTWYLKISISKQFWLNYIAHRHSEEKKKAEPRERKIIAIFPPIIIRHIMWCEDILSGIYGFNNLCRFWFSSLISFNPVHSTFFFLFYSVQVLCSLFCFLHSVSFPICLLFSNGNHKFSSFLFYSSYYFINIIYLFCFLYFFFPLVLIHPKNNFPLRQYVYESLFIVTTLYLSFWKWKWKCI